MLMSRILCNRLPHCVAVYKLHSHLVCVLLCLGVADFSTVVFQGVKEKKQKEEKKKKRKGKLVMHLDDCSVLWHSEIHLQSWQIILWHSVSVPSSGPHQAHSFQWVASCKHQIS